MTKRVVIYTRVSTEEQAREGHSLEAQYDICAKFASSRNWNIVDHLQDAGKSGKSDNRPSFQKMLGYVRSGQCDVVLTHKLDRFSRNIVHILTYMREFAKLEVSYCSANEQFDFTTPMGKVMLAMLAAFAEWYLDNLSAETTKGKKQRAKKGLWNGLPPFGYRKGSDGKLDLVPKEVEAVRTAFEKCASGTYTDREIATMLNDQGFRTRPFGQSKGKSRPFSKDAVRAMLNNPFYAGKVTYRGKNARKRGKPRFSVAGQHESIISDDLFERVQIARHRNYSGHRGRRVYDTAVYPASGILFCNECGNRLRGAKLRNVRQYFDDFRGKQRQCTQKCWTNAENVEDQLGSFFSTIELPPDWRKSVLERLDAIDPGHIHKERETLELRRKRTQQLFTWGDISETDYRQQVSKIKTEIAELRPPRHHEVFTAGDLLADIGRIWGEATLKEKKSLLPLVIQQAEIESRCLVSVTPTPPFYAVMTAQLERYVVRSRRDSNPRSLP